MKESGAARLVGMNAAVAAAYAALAWAVSSLSTRPMGAVPYWPAAGLAVALAITTRWRLLPGVWLGSFLYQLHSFAGETTVQTVLNAGLPAIGSCVQAWIGGEFVRRWVGERAPLDDGPSVVRFIVYSGPLSCLIAPTLGTGMLSVLGSVGPGEKAGMWLNWWVGDSLGVVTVAPLLHMLRVQGRNRRVFKRAAAVTLPALGAAAATLFAFASIRDREADALQAAFEKEAAGLARGLQNNLHGYEVVLESLRAYFQTIGAVSRVQFRNFAESIILREPGIQALAWSPIVPEGEGPAWLSRAVADGVEDFHWRGANEAGEIVAIDDPGLSPVIYYIEPVESNAAALGFAIRTNPGAWVAIERAIETGQPHATGRVRLVQESGDQWGIVAYAPLYEGLVVLDDPDARGTLFRGAVSVVLRAGKFLHAGMPAANGTDFDVRLVDMDAPEAEAELAVLDHPQIENGPRALKCSIDDITFFGRQWRLDFLGSTSPQGHHTAGNSLLVLGGGMVFTTVLTAFMLLVTGHAERIGELVEQRTEELRNEIEERSRAQEATQEARLQAERANAAKSRFLAAVSHEIRTPINAIIGMSELLAGSKLPPEQKDFADTIMRAGNGLLAIVNDILDLARIEAGRMELRSEPFGPVHLMEELQALFSLRASNKGIGLRFEIDPALPAAVKGDSARVRQVLINLIGNAVKFTREGEVVVGAAVAGGGTDRVLLRFDVRDTGPGMSSDDLPRLFQPFTQVRGDASQEGTGLGLAISSQLVNLMKGGMAVESLQGEGTRFTVTIPFAVCTPVESSDSFDDSSHDVSFAQLAVLVAEDNSVNRKVAAKMLERLGVVNVVFAEDGEQAVESARGAEFSLVLMDCDMPRMDGLDATRMIRSLEGGEGNGRHVRIVAMTAHAMEGDRERCLEAGMDDYIQKPVTLDALRRCLVAAARQGNP